MKFELILLIKKSLAAMIVEPVRLEKRNLLIGFFQKKNISIQPKGHFHT